MDATSSLAARELGPALAALPLFPLPQTVLFPGALLPLHVFEPRYRAMVRDCLATHRAIAVVLIREHGERAGVRHPAIEDVAGVGLIVDHVELPDGRFNILLRGRARVRLEEIAFVPPYRRAHGTILETPAHSEELAPRELAALLASAALFAADIRARDPEFDFQIPPHTPAGAAVDLAAHHLILDARERQALLETVSVSARVRRATEALALQHVALHGTAGGTLN